MRQLCMFILVFSFGIMSLKAEEPPQRRPHIFSFSYSACYEAQPDNFSRNSILGFGVLLFSNKGLNIQNHNTYSTGTMNLENTGGKLYQHLITEKVSIGAMSPDRIFRPYGFVEGRIGWCGPQKFDMYDNPLIIKYGLGTGLDIFALENWSFFMELGFLGNQYQNEFIMQQRFELGVKCHFLPVKK